MWIFFFMLITLTTALTGFGLVAYMMIAAGRRGRSSIKSKPSHILSIPVPGDPRSALKTVVRAVAGTGYVIDDIDESLLRVILREPESFNKRGFFYPIYFSDRGDSKTLVEVGIKPIMFAIHGPIVSRRHEQCTNMIRAALMQ